MILAIVGRPGGGKSYEAVAFHVIPALKEGRKVITNLTLNIEHLVKVFGNDVHKLIVIIDGQLDNFGSATRPFSKINDYQDPWRNEKEQGPLYVIDEAHMALPLSGVERELLEWYSLHRHYGVDVILMTQNIRKVHRDIKDLVEVTYQCTKNTALGSSKSYTRKVRDGWKGDTVNTGIRTYKSAYYKFYQSHSQSSKAVLEANAKDIVPIWKRWPVVGALTLLSLGLVVNVWLWTDTKPSPQSEVKVSTDSLVKPVNAQVKEGTPTKTPSGKFGPLSQFDMVVTGFAKQIAYRSRQKNTAELNRDLTFYKIYIDVYDGDTRLFSFDQTDLQEIGYTFIVLSDCVYQVSWNAIDKVITCREEMSSTKTDALSEVIPI